MKNTFFTLLLSFIQYTSSAQEFNYWNEIFKCEKNVGVNNELAVKDYFQVFRSNGVRQIDNWWNAIIIAERQKSPYSDSLVRILARELDLSLLLDKKTKLYYKSKIPNCGNLITKYITVQNSKKLKKKSRTVYKKWRIFKRKDQFPRKLLIVPLKILQKIDKKNRQLFFEKYDQNANNLPNRIELGRLLNLEPYWCLFQHYNINYRSVDTLNTAINMDMILQNELRKGNLNPKYIQYHIIYQVMRDIDKGEIKIFTKPDEFMKSWFAYKNVISFEDLQKQISQEQIDFINAIRDRFCMEKLEYAFFLKKNYFEENGLILR